MTLYTTGKDSNPEVTPEELDRVHKQVSDFQDQILNERRRPFQNPNPKTPIIVYCMTFYDERVEQVKECLERVAPYVQRIVLVHDGTVKASDVDRLFTISDKKAEFVYRPWQDHFSKQRNAYLEHVNDGEFVLVSDPDELLCIRFLQDIRAILMEAEKQGINILGLNSHDITTEQDGKVTKIVSNSFKQLAFKMEEGVRYVNKVHETLLPGIHGWRIANLDPERYYYDHIKTYVEVKERGARNVFCGGGGLCVLEKNPLYQQWQGWTVAHMAAIGGVGDWPHMREYIRKGNIDFELKQMFIKHRNDNGWDWNNESRDPFLWYAALFPLEMKAWESIPGPPTKGSPPEVMAYVDEQYKQILGRPGDEMGKEHYTGMIVNGLLEREKLPEIFKASQEYKDKQTPPIL